MSDRNWQKYTKVANVFFDQGNKCCAYRFYQSALSEAEHLLMNSYNVEESVPVIPALMISYHNLYILLESENCYKDLSSYLRRATERFTGVLHTPEFPDSVRENCSKDIHRLYHSLVYYSDKYPPIKDECINYMNCIKEAVLYFSKTYDKKGIKNENI